MALSTVSAILKRIGLGKRSWLEPPSRLTATGASSPGMVHLDVKKLGRISRRGAGHRFTERPASQVQKMMDGQPRRTTGCEFVHVAVEDATRLTDAEVRPSELGPTAAEFLSRAIAWFALIGVTVQFVLSDNGPSSRSEIHAQARRELAIRRHLFTRPYRPRTNGKAESFIQTLISRWAYRAIYGRSAERTAALSGWLTHCN